MLNDILSFIFSSVFEAWYIKEHVEKLKLPTDWIPKTFADTTFFNGLAATLPRKPKQNLNEGNNNNDKSQVIVHKSHGWT